MRASQNVKMRELIKCIIMFFILCIFFYFVPYTDDDLRWGSQTGWNRLHNGFAGYGGRYLGYLIVIGLTRSVVFKVLFMSAVTIMIAYLIRYITRLQMAPYIVVLSIIVAPLSLFSSTMGWVSGFSNYVTSICFTLLYIAYIACFNRKEVKRSNVWMAVPLFLLGMINTLIVEHFTIYNVLLGIFIVVAFALQYKRIFSSFAGYMLGTLAGACWMFSNSAYSKALNGKDYYRNVGDRNGITLQSIYYGLYKICKYGYLDNIIMNIAIFIVFYFIVRKYRNNLCKSKQRLVHCCLFINFAYIIAGILLKRLFDYNNGTDVVRREFRFAFVALTLLSVFAHMVIVILFAGQHACFRKILFLLVSIMVLDAPFLVVNPVTPRVFFGSYILYTVELCILMKEICDEMKVCPEKEIVKFCKVGLTVGAVFYISVFSLIYKADMERLQDIRQQAAAGKKKVVMYSIPYEQFVHNITLSKKWQLRGYKQFYHLPKDLQLVAEKDKERDD